MPASAAQGLPTAASTVEARPSHLGVSQNFWARQGCMGLYRDSDDPSSGSDIRVAFRICTPSQLVGGCNYRESWKCLRIWPGFPADAAGTSVTAACFWNVIHLCTVFGAQGGMCLLQFILSAAGTPKALSKRSFSVLKCSVWKDLEPRDSPGQAQPLCPQPPAPNHCRKQRSLPTQGFQVLRRKLRYDRDANLGCAVLECCNMP